jgi:phosphatidylserine decarboxylase
MSTREAVQAALTSHIPRQLFTHFMGWFSKLEQPLLRDTSMAIWRRFERVDLSDAADVPYPSLHSIFTRALKPGSRPFCDTPGVIASPCDGIVVGAGPIDGDTLVQAKGQTYSLTELVQDSSLAAAHRGGQYVTLRLTPAMYHRFHAPQNCHVQHVTYVAGDTYNTHPAVLARVPRLYCQNERAILRARLSDTGERITLVPVAAILVASIRLTFANVHLHLRYRGPNEIPCSEELELGQEMGWFEHGSTIVVLGPPGATLCAGVALGTTLRAGMPLMQRAPSGGAA